MKMMSYFKKHFVTQVRNFVFAYRKSIERKCHTTDNNCSPYPDVIPIILIGCSSFVTHDDFFCFEISRSQ